MKSYFEENQKVSIWEKVTNKPLVLIMFACACIFMLLNQNNILNDTVDIQAEDKTLTIEMTSQENETTLLNQLYVDLKGEVIQPGVYQLQQGSRLIDLIEKAGGFTEDAAQDSLNLALLLEDQMMVTVYSQSEWDTLISDEQSEQKTLALDNDLMLIGASNEEEKQTLININIADQEELETLPQIGPSKAQKIIQYRQDYGSFKDIEEIVQVSGIGPKTFEGLKDLITVGF
ncbi:helix-hairpin-helix domain-containing protein [Facklamia sp. 7083-14-GEN3]|uniref:helix-hairpin-helix domain-containing protein n=1 Tax=Facklamia sp. 7083-14-GEN3 TaxID=2973478 RepID=UPI00215C9BEE|nr:helix-hairpin-helix domain-containing protein [Facklamia sp. 7083-14-GEN3]MCR8969250.1 helix-hairpin-helix domain-containing protein [Facklamia sp. 7083-14-GEN3]